MKSRISILITITLLFFAADGLLAVRPIFKVIASNGNVTCKADGKWSKVKTGAVLTPGNVVKIKSGGYLGLVFSNGRTIELSKAGEYNISELAGKVKSKNASVSKRFADYVVSEISEADDMLSDGDYHGNMEITGSVERSMPEDTKKSDEMNFLSIRNQFNILAPRKTTLTEPVMTIDWDDIPSIGNYRLVVTDRFENKIYSSATAISKFDLDLTDEDIESGQYYFWHIESADNPKIHSESSAFTIMQPEDAEAIDNKLAELKQELDDENSPLGLIVIGSFYEKNGLYFDAMNAYHKAVEKSPGVEEYRKLYDLYVYRIKRNK